MGLHQNLVVELLRNQQEMLRQNQVLMQSMVNRMEREERAREEEREGRRSSAKQAEEAAAWPSTDPLGGAATRLELQLGRFLPTLW